MHKSVAACAQGDEIMRGVVSDPAPLVDVVNVELARVPAALAAPAIPLQYPLSLFPVRLAIELHPRSSWKRAHLRDGPRAEGLPPLPFVAH